MADQTGIEPPSAAGSAPPPPTALEGAPWLALFYVGPDGRLLPVLLDTEVTAAFQGGRVTGSAGCNSYTAGYTLAQDPPGAIRFTPPASTLRACADPPGVMEQEAAYLRALERAERYAVEEGRLVLRTSDGSPLLLYVPQPQRSLEGTDWVAVSFNDGRGVVSLLAGTEITARFEAGRLSGSAGCNRYTAGYTLTPDAAGAIGINQPASTRMFCADPPGVMDQEAAYLTALPTATRYRIEGQRLTLQRDDGALVAIYTAQGA